MDCKRAASLMMKYFDHTIEDLEEKEMMLHIEGCNCCRLDFEWMQEAISSVEIMEELEAPEGFEYAVMKKISASCEHPLKTRRNAVTYMAFAMAAAAVFLCGVLYFYYGAVNFREVHNLMEFIFTLMDLKNIFPNLVALISKNTVKILVWGICWLNDIAAVLIGLKINMYLLTIGGLCGIFVGIQHWLMRLTHETGYGRGKIYEK